MDHLGTCRLLLLDLLHQLEEPVPGTLDVRGPGFHIPVHDLELAPEGPCLHGEVRPVDREGPDGLGALRDLGLGPLLVQVDAVDLFQVPLLLFAQPPDGLLGESDLPFLCLEGRDEPQVLGPALLVDLPVELRELAVEPVDGCSYLGSGPSRLLEGLPLLPRGLPEGEELLLLLAELGGRAAALEVVDLIEEGPVLHRPVTFILELLEPGIELVEHQLLPFDPLPDHVQLLEGRLPLGVELGDPRNLVEDLPPLGVGHLHDPGDVPLHHHVVALGLDPDLCKKIGDVGLLAEPVVQVVVAVVPMGCPPDPPPDDGAVREADGYLGGVLPRVQVDEIGELLGTEDPGG